MGACPGEPKRHCVRHLLHGHPGEEPARAPPNATWGDVERRGRRLIVDAVLSVSMPMAFADEVHLSGARRAKGARSGRSSKAP